MKNTRRGLLVLMILFLLVTACGADTEAGDNNTDGPNSGFNFTEDEPAENQPEDEGIEFEENEVENPDNDSQGDDEQTFEFDEADDACLEGTWLLNIGTFGSGLASRLNENLTDASFDVTPVMGELRLVFDGDFVEMRTDVPLFFLVNFTAAGMLLSEMEIEVTANGSAQWIADESHIIFYGQNVHAEGSGDWESEVIGAAGAPAGSSNTVTLDYTMGDLFVHSNPIDLSSLGLDLTEDEEQLWQFYDCDETLLLLFTNAGIHGDQWFDRE